MRVGRVGAMVSAWAILAASVAWAGDIVVVQPHRETQNLPDNVFEADADDPAIWVHPTDPKRSLVITAVKDGGIRVYDLKARTVQVIDPVRTVDGDGRINNVDVAYGLALPDGARIDVAVATDRALDRIRIYRIDPDRKPPLVEITEADPPRAFPTRPTRDQKGVEANPLDEQDTAYGLALWRDRTKGRHFVAVSQRNQPRIGLFRLVPTAAGTVTVRQVADWLFPGAFRGQDLFQESDDDPLQDWSPQFEGMVVDHRTGILYAGQEDVGIWRIDLNSRAADKAPFVTTRGAPTSPFYEPKSPIARDVEGLTIYYGGRHGSYLIASSQGAAHGDDAAPDPPWDDSFAVFQLAGTKLPTYRGSFRVGASKSIDAVQESDGADVIARGLPGFPQGLFVTQDGYDNDLNGLDGEVDSTNFKFVRWEEIAKAFNPPLAVAPAAKDPRLR